MVAGERQPEPLIDPSDPYLAWDMTIPLQGVNLIGLPGGKVSQPENFGGRRFLRIRDFEAGDSLEDVDPDLTAEDPDQWPQVRENHHLIKPDLWLATDILTRHQTGQDGYYDKFGVGLSALLAIAKTSLGSNYDFPTALVASNDHTVEMTDYPGKGRYQAMQIAEQLSSLLTANEVLPKLEDRPRLSEVLSYMAGKATKSVVVVVSDFRGLYFWPDAPEDNWQGGLLNIAGKNEVIAVEVTSPEDSSLPTYLHSVNNSPGGRIWAGKKGAEFRDKYDANAPKQQEAIDRAISDAGALHIRLRTDEPNWGSSLSDQLKDPSLRVA